MSKVGILDYGAGNIASLINILNLYKVDLIKINKESDFNNVNKIILPGVGAAGFALENLRKKNLENELNKYVIEKGIPFLGICVGMQILAKRIHEFGSHLGLGWIDGEVQPLNKYTTQLTVPHMGWNEVKIDQKNNDEILKSISKNSFYFAHSNVMHTKESKLEIAYFNYGIKFLAALKKNNILAVQFHPEKSYISGQRFLKNFINWNP